MNKEEILAMSNAEINMMCAIYIMGFNHRGYCEDVPEHPYVSPNPQGKLVLYSAEGYANWNPTEDMNDAMKMVDKLQETKSFEMNSRWLNFSFEQMKYGEITYNAFITDEESNKTYDGNGKTAALAISYACLLAVMDS